MSLWVGPGTPGDYPPVSTDSVRGSLPIVPAESSYYRGMWTIPERPTADSVVDLISGSPLLQDVDLELPFGGAVFRHLRTYGEIARIGMHEDRRVYPYVGRQAFQRVGAVRPIDQMWDWAGQGWAIGQNPMFLFEAQYAGIVAMPDVNGQPNSENSPMRCYFIPDAHHSIPFERQMNTTTGLPDYVAPPEYDAKLSYDTSGGVQWNSSNSTWTTRPTTFHVWLNRARVHYTIQLASGDMPTLPSGHPASDRPTQYSDPNGFGLPRWGRVTRIEDRVGNYVLQDYCSDRLRSSPLQFYGTNCETCLQNCQERGQLVRTRLYAAGASESSPTWTLLYTYRPYEMNPASTSDNQGADGTYGRAVLRQNVLFATFAYVGNVVIPSDSTGPKCLTMPLDYFEVLPNAAFTATDENGRLYRYLVDNNHWGNQTSKYAMKYIDQIVDPVSEFQLPANWVHQVRYLHSSDAFSCLAPYRHQPWAQVSRIGFQDTNNGGVNFAGAFEAPRLVKAMVRTRPHPDDSDPSKGETSRRKVFIYDYPKDLQMAPGDTATLRAVYEDQTLCALEKGIMSQSGDNHVDAVDDYDIILNENPATGHNFLYDASPTPSRTIDHLATTNFDQIGGVLVDGCQNDNSMRAVMDQTTGQEGGLRGDIDNYIADLGSEDITVANTYWVGSGVRAIVHRGENSVIGSATRMYRFVNLPGVSLPTEVTQYRTFERSRQGFLRSLYHYPFRFIPFNHTLVLDGDGCDQVPDSHSYLPDAVTPFWITVIDEFKPGELGSSDPVSGAGGAVYDGSQRSARRIVVMNRAGWVLREKIWRSDGKVLTHGTQATLIRDNKGRLIEKRSLGWGSTANQANNPGTHGLVEIYEYPPPASPPDPTAVVSAAPIRVGVRQGSQGASDHSDVVWTHAWEYGITQRPDLLAREVKFVQPTTGTFTIDSLASTQAEVTKYIYQFGNSPNNDPVMTAQAVVQPAAQKGFDTGYFLGVQVTLSDTTGRVTAKGYGDLRSISNQLTTDADASLGDRFYWDTYAYEAETSTYHRHRLVQEVVDDGTSTSATNSSFVPCGRIAPTSTPPLNLTTSYAYDAEGVTSVTHTSGAVDFTVRRTNATTGQREQLVYSNCTSQGGNYTCNGTVTIAQIGLGNSGSTGGGGAVQQATEYRCTASFGSAPTGEEALTPIAKTTPQYGAGGALTGVKVEDPNDSSIAVSAALDYDGWGNVIREVTPSLSILRRQYNALGQLERVYRGTNDQHEIWGTAAPVGGTCVDDSMYQSNLILSEKRTYGDGATDANKLVCIRHYRTKVDNPYGLVVPLGSGCTIFPPPNNEDKSGDVEGFQFDVRMRPVWHEHRSTATSDQPDGVLVSAEATYFDHAGRARFVATYGPNGSVGTLDPRSRDTSLDVPSAASILATAPLMLRETRYSGRGDAQEQREYDVLVTDASAYIATATYYDRDGRTVWSQSPNQGSVVCEYDAQGRLVSSATRAGSRELEKTVNSFDANRNVVIETVHWERTDNASGAGDALDSTNAVGSRSFSWYDALNRPIASAQLGTERTDDTYQQSSFHVSRPTTIDRTFNSTGMLTAFTRPSTLPTAIITATAYDLRGQVVGTCGPRGAVTWNTYDALGRVILKVENATDTATKNRRATAYKYENGQLVAMAAVRSGATTPVTNWLDSNLDLQITRVAYGDAQLYYTDGTPATKSNDLPKSIRFSRIPCGADYNNNGIVETQDIFDFLADWFNVCTGQSGDPCNGRSADFNHDGVLSPQDIFDFLNFWFAPPVDCLGGADGGDLAFTYTADGRLRSRENPSGAMFTYSYDALARLGSIEVSGSGQYSGPDAPVNALSHIDYSYDDASRLQRSDAYAQAASGASGRHLVASSLFEYDGMGRLTREHMALGASATTGSPATVYGWQTVPPSSSNISGASRLASITYPLQHLMSTPSAGVDRLLSLSYGSSGSLDDTLSRITQLTDSNAGTAVAKYGYVGASRRVTERRGVPTTGTASITQTYFDDASPTALTGLDSFGRVKSLKYLGHNIDAGASPLTIFQADHGYDMSSNRTKDTATRSDLSGGSLYGTNQATSWVYGYDKLDRLITAKTGHPTTSSPGIVADATRVDHAWAMDELGNWGQRNSDHQMIGGYSVKGYDPSGALDPAAATNELHRTSERNELAVATRSVTVWDEPSQDYITTDTDSHFGYDKPGRLIYDMKMVHRYDAWGRLVELRAATLSFNGDGTINWSASNPSGVGQLAAHYTYDGLGRLVATQKPATYATGSGNVVSSIKLTKHFYDGSRRIQDVASSAIPVSGPVTMDTSRWPDPDGAGPQTGASMAAATTFLPSREYIYEPDGDVDAQVAQYGYTYPAAPTSLNDSGTLLYVLQDVNLNVVALTDSNGVPAAQIAYTPYGQPVLFDNQQSSSAAGAVAATSPIGHQGLFYDRFDVGAAASTAAILDAGETKLGYYHNRNRTYAPRLGRFVQRDPNASGQVGEESLFRCGGTPSNPAADAPEVRSMCGNGLSLHQYAYSAPTGIIDPTGLFGILDIGIGSTTMEDLYQDQANRDMEIGQTMKAVADAFLSTAAINQLFDLDWASNWNAPDSWNTRSGIDDAAYYAMSGGGGGVEIANGTMMAGAFDGQTAMLGLGGRVHGGDWHNAMLHANAEYYATKFGAENVRFNQGVKLADGTAIRPDLLVYDPRKQEYKLVEVMDKSPLSRSQMAERVDQVSHALGGAEVKGIAVKKGEQVGEEISRLYKQFTRRRIP